MVITIWRWRQWTVDVEGTTTDNTTSNVIHRGSRIDLNKTNIVVKTGAEKAAFVASETKNASINVIKMLKNIKKRWKKAVNTDNIIDFSVDVGLIAFDVLALHILMLYVLYVFTLRNLLINT